MLAAKLGPLGHSPGLWRFLYRGKLVGFPLMENGGVRFVCAHNPRFLFALNQNSLYFSFPLYLVLIFFSDGA